MSTELQNIISMYNSGDVEETYDLIFKRQILKEEFEHNNITDAEAIELIQAWTGTSARTPVDDKHYTYREDGDKWEVYGTLLNGEEDWAATTETETIAVLLVDTLNV